MAAGSGTPKTPVAVDQLDIPGLMDAMQLKSPYPKPQKLRALRLLVKKIPSVTDDELVFLAKNHMSRRQQNYLYTSGVDYIRMATESEMVERAEADFRKLYEFGKYIDIDSLDASVRQRILEDARTSGSLPDFVPMSIIKRWIKEIDLSSITPDNDDDSLLNALEKLAK